VQPPSTPPDAPQLLHPSFQRVQANGTPVRKRTPHFCLSFPVCVCPEPALVDHDLFS
jgi:hypothetical protein